MLIDNKFNLGNCTGFIILHLAPRTHTPSWKEGRQLEGGAGGGRMKGGVEEERRSGGGEHEKQVHEKKNNKTEQKTSFLS